MNILNKFFLLLFPHKDTRVYENCDNLVLSIARCKKLYKKLSVLAHSDKHPENKDLASEIMEEININRYDYAKLLELEKRINEELL